MPGPTNSTCARGPRHGDAGLTPGPLDGIRVIDLTTVISGPVCTMILADQGADVIKVEPPAGDITRRTAGDGEFTAMFVSSNRGKRSIALDLKQPAGAGSLAHA